MGWQDVLTIEVYLGVSIQSFEDKILMLRVDDVGADIESCFVVSILCLVLIEL